MPGPIFRALAIFALLAQFLWPRYFFVNVAGKGLSLFTFSAILMLLMAVYALYRWPDTRLRVAQGVEQSLLLVGTFIVLFLWRIVADLAGDSPVESLGYTGLDFIYLGSWFLSVAVLFTDGRLRRIYPWLAVVGILGATLFGLIELQTRQPLSETLGFAGFSAGDKYVLDTINTAEMRGETYRIRSLFAQPLVYGQFVACLTPYALYLILRPNWFGRIAGVAAIIGALVSVQLCNARSPLILMAAGGAAFAIIFLFDFRKRARLMTGLAGAIVALFLIPVVTGTLMTMIQGRTSEEAISSGARTMQLEKGTHALDISPITGFGGGNALQYAGTATTNNQFSIDNYYLTDAVNYGYVGAGLLSLFFLTILIQGTLLVMRFDRQAERSADAASIACAAAAILSLVVVSVDQSLSLIYIAAGHVVAASGAAARQRRGNKFDWQSMLARGQTAP